MASSEWSSMGCGDYKSEWDCVKGIGQDAANAAFKTHWQTWITKDDITRMVSYGLNTIRVCNTVIIRMYSVSDTTHRSQSASGCTKT